MREHNYILESAVPGSAYYWVIFCTKCGYVAWCGNSSNASLEKLQANRPLECIGTRQTMPEEA